MSLVYGLCYDSMGSLWTGWRVDGVAGSVGWKFFGSILPFSVDGPSTVLICDCPSCCASSRDASGPSSQFLHSSCHHSSCHHSSCHHSPHVITLLIVITPHVISHVIPPHTIAHHLILVPSTVCLVATTRCVIPGSPSPPHPMIQCLVLVAGVGATGPSLANQPEPLNQAKI